ncbi:uncharacterized protein [Nicotiana tomentosiformis]|uniref:uncharacterized protein n=1 Tax=Nicotiana tomentosiformis TaxID=4098 RepID=UPI00388C9EB0
MVKTSKTVSQKEKASSSQSAADKTPVDPRPEECIPAACVLTSDFKLDKCSPVPGRFLRLRDEEEEEEENDGSALAARTKKTTDTPQAAGSMVVHKAPPRTEDISERDSGRVPKLLEIEDVSHRSRLMGDMSEGALPKSFRTEENALDNSFGVVAIEGSPTFPAFSTGAIREAQALGALELDRPHDGEDPFRDLFIGVEDTAGTSDASDLFHGVQHALNQAATVHRESCSRSRTELRRYEAELQRVTEERNSLKLLLGQKGEEIKDLQAELARAHQDQIDLSEQLQQKIEMIEKLREEVDVIRAESLKWKVGMDRFAAKKETARAQLSSAENQLQKMKEKSSVQARGIEELEARLASVQAREVAEAADTRAHWVTELAKFRSRRETLEEIHARGFDLAEEIKRAKEFEVDAEALVSDDDDDDNDDDDESNRGGGSPIEKRPLLGMTRKLSP